MPSTLDLIVNVQVFGDKTIREAQLVINSSDHAGMEQTFEYNFYRSHDSMRVFPWYGVLERGSG